LTGISAEDENSLPYLSVNITKGDAIKDINPKPSPAPLENNPKYSPENIMTNPNINLAFSITVEKSVLPVISAPQFIFHSPDSC